MLKIINNKKVAFLLLLSLANLLFMHYFFYINGYLEWTWSYSEIINLCSVFFDVFVLLFLFLLFAKGRLKTATFLTFFVTYLWSFVNVVYGRFFFQYMSLSAIGEANGLGDSLVINSVISAFYWYDLFYVVSCIVFVYLCRNIVPIRLQLNKTFNFLLIPFLSLLITFLSYSVYHFIHPHYRNNWELYEFRAKEFLYDPVRGGTPNLAHFQIGCIRVALYELYDLLHEMELTEDQIKQIEEYYHDYSKRTTRHQRNPKIRNIIFVLLESFLSAPIDMKIDGKEVTPFLNSLKRDSDVYYNGNMISDIGCGESGDGQFIYMTGILPLKYKMTVGQVKKHELPALPKVLVKELGLKNTIIIYPTMPNLWQQTDMNVAYGIVNSYSMIDILGSKDGEINDQHIFEFAAKTLSNCVDPFFSLILSVSGHSPYNSYKGDDLFGRNNDYPVEFLNYLNTCHFTDAQIEKFIGVLKDRGIYEKSLIVLCADHYAHLDMLKMNDKISMHIPLFIINGGIFENEVWKGIFHQLDTYTTLLDILSINVTWKGLGYTLMYPTYYNSVTDYSYNVSNMIIEGDYFENSTIIK